MLSQLNEIAKNYEYLIKAVGAFLPFLLAIFMAYIAYQQWLTNERKRKQDLFELRHKNLIQPITEILNYMHANNLALVQKGINDFYASYSKYRYLIKDNDARELDYTLKTMLNEYSAYMNHKDIYKYSQKTAYNLGYIEEVLYNYMHIEDNYINLYSFIKKIIFNCTKFFIPIKLQEKIIKKHRRNIAIKEMEEIADKYDELNKVGTTNAK